MVTKTAHGRVNLIGEHTDYNGGWVLPTAIPQYTSVRLEKRAGREVQCESQEQGLSQYQLGAEKKTGTWIDYLQGATFLAQKQGLQVPGLKISIDSTVPMGSGLSSSAALEVAFLKALRELMSWRIEDVELAHLAQAIENDFVGARVGIMDQMACTFCQFGEALFLDTQTLKSERIPLPLDVMDLVVINSGVSHRLTDGGYNQRRAECEEACANMGVGSLRELGIDSLPEIAQKSRPVVARRAHHVLHENERVHQTVRALKAKDLKAAGQLFYASHKSMREDYQVSIPEIDLMIELCQAQASVFGARLTGGGFGGSIVALTQKDQGAKTAALVVKKYQEATGQKATILLK
jgi:galactokinase